MKQQIQIIDTSSIIAGDNDRTIFKKSDLQNLAASIEENGLLQPITLRLVDKDGEPLYEIVAGERRFRACMLLNWTTVPAIVADLTEAEASAMMLTENTARVNLDPVDEARAFNDRLHNDGWSIEDIARKAGVSEVYVHFRLKLLKLRDDIQYLVRSGNIKLGYAQILADADLDSNRQRLTIQKLNINAVATPAWFRTLCNQYAQEQSQEKLMADRPLLIIQKIVVPTKNVLPPLPGKDTPPTGGNTPAETIHIHIKFWEDAASQWNDLGKVFKKKECLAAASALKAALSIMEQ